VLFPIGTAGWTSDLAELRPDALDRPAFSIPAAEEAAIADLPRGVAHRRRLLRSWRVNGAGDGPERRAASLLRKFWIAASKLFTTKSASLS
jgi:hypothetical protein